MIWLLPHPLPHAPIARQQLDSLSQSSFVMDKYYQVTVREEICKKKKTIFSPPIFAEKVGMLNAESTQQMFFVLFYTQR
jgi:hypothetical protein